MAGKKRATNVAAAKAGTAPVTKKKDELILMNTAGEAMDPADYFFKPENEDALLVPPYFNRVCGKPVDREELVEIFNKIFKPEDNCLFYKTPNKEVYVVVVPLKLARTVGHEHNSLNGDFQKHAMSFVKDGSVNFDSMKTQLKRISKFIFTDDAN